MAKIIVISALRFRNTVSSCRLNSKFTKTEFCTLRNQPIITIMKIMGSCGFGLVVRSLKLANEQITTNYYHLSLTWEQLITKIFTPTIVEIDLIHYAIDITLIFPAHWFRNDGKMKQILKGLKMNLLFLVVMATDIHFFYYICCQQKKKYYTRLYTVLQQDIVILPKCGVSGSSLNDNNITHKIIMINITSTSQKFLYTTQNNNKLSMISF